MSARSPFPLVRNASRPSGLIGRKRVALWTDWERALCERDGEAVDQDTVFKPTLHGLRSTAIVTRRLAGYSVQPVSNDIGMSISMVEATVALWIRRLPRSATSCLSSAPERHRSRPAAALTHKRGTPRQPIAGGRCRIFLHRSGTLLPTASKISVLGR